MTRVTRVVDSIGFASRDARDTNDDRNFSQSEVLRLMLARRAVSSSKNRHKREQIMKRAIVLSLAIGVLGIGILQAGHSRWQRGCGCNVPVVTACGSTAISGSSAASAVAPVPQSAVAQSNTNSTTYRSFSYEPVSNPAPGNFYYTTESSGYRSSTRTKPTYMLPNADPRKHSGGF